MDYGLGICYFKQMLHFETLHFGMWLIKKNFDRNLTPYIIIIFK